MIDVSNWKKFNLIDLFEFELGKGLNSKEGDYPRITATKFKNGHGGLSDKVTHSNCFTLATNGTCGITFWHPYGFSATSDVCVLIPDFEVTNNIGIFISTVMSKSLIPKFSYSKKSGLDRIKKESIYLPAKDGNIDFDWIESFMENLEVNAEQVIINAYRNSKNPYSVNKD